MRNEEEFEREISEFLNKINEFEVAQRKEILMLIFKKHTLQNESDLILDRHDLELVSSMAKAAYVNLSLPHKIGGKFVDNSYLNVIATIEATIGLLNNKCAFRRFPKFDRR